MAIASGPRLKSPGPSQLSLFHHGCHRLSARKLAALTAVHNFYIRRADQTTAAERFFGQAPPPLFEQLLERVLCHLGHADDERARRASPTSRRWPRERGGRGYYQGRSRRTQPQAVHGFAPRPHQPLRC
ncbi:DUF6399 domain-containing protein [Lamprobacter modestohalophilus]|uniref:DUF6399 domain-containing protein n=1 Tax=Lamprobacter modestohalophilus TaxID=1064514 RepID=UPI002ADEFC43|nr:DUF6399 domain-containing protein [Lamprobacter modestohalophilus]MEA1052030.1 DUF6399 domain-containing protein [Lamprobacter modestohalophilus]